MFEKKTYNQKWQSSSAKAIEFMQSEVQKEMDKLDEEYSKKIKVVEIRNGKYINFFYEYNLQVLAFFTIIRKTLFYGNLAGFIDFAAIHDGIALSKRQADRYEKRKLRKL